MVEHDKIVLNRKSLRDYICNPSHREWANKCSKFLEEFPLRAYCYQYPTTKDYTCWYVSFEDRQNPYIMHFNVYKKGMTIWFRYPEYLPESVSKQLKWDNNWQYMPIHELNEKVRQTVADYLQNIKEPFYKGKLKGRIHKKCQAEAL